MSGSKKISDKNLASFRGRKKATCFAGGRLLVFKEKMDYNQTVKKIMKTTDGWKLNKRGYSLY